ncbi:hypothetical protein [Arthrobacter sp. I3]|uniref:hypothetical protein n=1 Tax=Arthrobacter sp. I3 TaxID=218158 RepID=UPI0004821317|nr:hypothetical protein [Arthrobacter sp. I3]
MTTIPDQTDDASTQTGRVNVFKARWLATLRTTPGLSAGDNRVGEWLANNLHGGTTVLRTWQQMRNELRLPNHAAGVHLTTLARLGFVGERIRTGPNAGFPLELPLPTSAVERTVSSYETRAEVEARNARRAAGKRAADLRADAKRGVHA